MIYVLLSILIFSHGVLLASNHEWCEKRQEFYQGKRTSLHDSFAQQDWSDTSIVFIGEPHANFPNLIYPTMIKELRKSGFMADCYLLEADQTEKLTSSLKEFNALPPHESLPGLENMLYPGLFNVVEAAHRLGLDVHAVDNHKITGDLVSWMNARDQHMAQEIRRLKNEGACHKMIYPVGSSHITSRQKSGRVNLKTLMEKNKIENFSILANLIGLNEMIEGMVNPLTMKPYPPSVSSYWLLSTKPFDFKTIFSAKDFHFLCPSNPTSTRREPFVLVPSEADSHPVAMNYNKESFSLQGQYSDFDLVYVYSCQEKACRGDNAEIERFLSSLGMTFY